MSVTYVAPRVGPVLLADFKCAVLVQGKENKTAKVQSLLEYTHIFRISCATLYNDLWCYTKLNFI
jgi:hypothetical protein